MKTLSCICIAENEICRATADSQECNMKFCFGSVFAFSQTFVELEFSLLSVHWIQFFLSLKLCKIFPQNTIFYVLSSRSSIEWTISHKNWETHWSRNTRWFVFCCLFVCVNTRKSGNRFVSLRCFRFGNIILFLNTSTNNLYVHCLCVCVLIW